MIADETIEDLIASAIDADDPALVKIDAGELQKIIAAAAEDRRELLRQMNEMLSAFEARIAAIEETLRSR